MPFTFSHPAAVLPFKYLPKGWTSLTGLVIGSMVPDFEKFLKMEGGNSYSHTWSGIFWFCIPLGILLSFIFHQVAREPLIDNLPAFLRNRLAKFKQLDWEAYFKQHYLTVIISIIIGAATHLVWDDFTHKNGEYERQFPLLSGAVRFGSFKLPVFAFLNWVSSVLGVVVVLLAILRLPTERAVACPAKNKAYWPTFMLVALIVIVLRLATGLTLNEGVLKLKQEFWDLIITLVSAGLISLVVTPLILRRVTFK